MEEELAQSTMRSSPTPPQSAIHTDWVERIREEDDAFFKDLTKETKLTNCRGLFSHMNSEGSREISSWLVDVMKQSNAAEELLQRAGFASQELRASLAANDIQGKSEGAAVDENKRQMCKRIATGGLFKCPPMPGMTLPPGPDAPKPCFDVTCDGYTVKSSREHTLKTCIEGSSWRDIKEAGVKGLKESLGRAECEYPRCTSDTKNFVKEMITTRTSERIAAGYPANARSDLVVRGEVLENLLEQHRQVANNMERLKHRNIGEFQCYLTRMGKSIGFICILRPKTDGTKTICKGLHSHINRVRCRDKRLKSAGETKAGFSGNFYTRASMMDTHSSMGVGILHRPILKQIVCGRPEQNEKGETTGARCAVNKVQPCRAKPCFYGQKEENLVLHF